MLSNSHLSELIADHLEAFGAEPQLLNKVREVLAKQEGPDTDLLRLFRQRRSWRSSLPAPPSPEQTPTSGAARSSTGSGDASPILECHSPIQLISGKAPSAAKKDAAEARDIGPLRGVVPVCIVLLLSCMFLPCVTYSEWYIDELFAAVRNEDARGESSLAQVFSNDFWGNPLWAGGWTHKSYRPLVVLSYAWQYKLNGGVIRPEPLRAFNVALHAANSVLVYLLLLRHCRIPWKWATVAAGLFATHPVHCENIIYLVGRADAMATACWLAALFVWPAQGASGGLRSRMFRVLLVASLAVIGGICKEIGFVVLLQLAASELLGRQPLRGAVPLLSIFFIVYLGRSWYTDGTKAGFSHVDTPVQYHADFWVRTWTYLYFHGKYAQLMVFPWTLSWDYSLDALPLMLATWRDVRSLLVLTAYLGIVSLASLGFSTRSRRLLLGISNIIIPFVPASNLFFVVGVTVGERLLYPCNVGFAMVVASVGSMTSTIPGKSVGKSRSLKPLIALALLMVFLTRGSLRVYQWSSRETLFGPDAMAYPRSTKARHQYGTVLHRVGRFDEALVHFNASLQIFPQSALTEYCMAQIYLETGRAQQAIDHLENIFGGHGLGFGRFNLYALYVDYGFALMMLGRYAEAIPQLAHGLELNEDVPHGLNALGYTYMQLQRYHEALDAFQRGLRYDPENFFIMNNLGVAHLLAGNLEVGADMVTAAFQRDPETPAFAKNVQLIGMMAQTNRWPNEHFALELFYNRGT